MVRSKLVSDLCIRLILASIVCLLAQGAMAQSPLVRYRPVVTDLIGNPISSIAPNTNFMLRIFVQDISVNPQGVFAAYVDATYDPAFVAVNGPIVHVPPYTNLVSGNTTTPGLIDEVGATDGVFPLGGAEFELARIPMTSLGNLGQTTFALDPADDDLSHATLLYGSSTNVTNSEIIFGSVTLTIPEPTTSVLLLALGLGVLVRPRSGVSARWSV